MLAAVQILKLIERSKFRLKFMKKCIVKPNASDQQPISNIN